MGDKVFAAGPGNFNPFLDASEIAVTSRDLGRIAEAGGYGSYGEAAGLIRNARGKVVAVQFAGTRLLPGAKVAAEMSARYDRKRTAKRKRFRSA